MRTIGISATATAAVVAVIGLSGCGSTVSGVAVAGDISMGATATAVPSSMTRPATLEELVADTAARASGFWRAEGAEGTDTEGVLVTGRLTCNGYVIPGSAALFCPGSTVDSVKVDASVLQQRRERGGDLAVEITVAHEVGHGAHAAEGIRDSYPTRAAEELSADCAAGAYLRNANADPLAVERALPFTALGKDTAEIGLRATDRRDAFNAGFTGKTAPMACLTDYLR